MKAIPDAFFLGVPEWREIADFGTVPDLNHLLEGVERSELVLGGREISPEVVGHLQKLAKRRGKADSGTFSDLNHLLDDAVSVANSW